MLAGSEYYALLYFLKKYNQMEVAPEDCYITAFVTYQVFLIYNVMPFRLSNAPETFQRLMTLVLGSLICS